MNTSSTLTVRSGIYNTINLSVLFILVNAFLWYYLTFNITTIISVDFNVEQIELLSFYSLGVLIGGIIGLLLPKNRHKILLLWTFLGALTSALPLIPTLSDFQVICFIWGFSFGLGMPTCLAYFSRNIKVENRGHLGGVTLLVSSVCAITVTSLIRPYGLSIMYLFSSFWRLLGFIPLFLLRGRHKEKETEIEKSGDNYATVSMMQNRLFYFYFVPWLMFNVADSLEGQLLKEFVKAVFTEYIRSLLSILSLTFFGISAFLGGFLCDSMGRKPVTILGFTIMGIAYSIVSMISRVTSAWFLFYVCNGISWGLLNTVFIMVIWGDLALKGAEEKYYFVGNIPLFLALIIQKYFASYMMLLSESNAFSLAAIFLFLAVIPILFASETLPKERLRTRELKSYIEKAKKIKEKFT